MANQQNKNREMDSQIKGNKSARIAAKKINNSNEINWGKSTKWMSVVVVVKDLGGTRDQEGGRQGGAAHLRRGDQCWVCRDRTALTGGGSVGRRPPGRRPGSAASVAEARHHLSGSLREDELLAQLHVGPAFSWETTSKSATIDKKKWPESEFSCSLRWWSAV